MEGFEWVNADDSSRSIYSFIRHSKGAKKNLLFVCNFTPIERPEYRVGVPRGKQYRLVLNSDELQYGGSGKARPAVYKAKKQECDGRPYSFGYDLPLNAYIFCNLFRYININLIKNPFSLIPAGNPFHNRIHHSALWTP